MGERRKNSIATEILLFVSTLSLTITAKSYYSLALNEPNVNFIMHSMCANRNIYFYFILKLIIIKSHRKKQINAKIYALLQFIKLLFKHKAI